MTPRQATGFTLLELLVALVVLGFIFVGLSQGVRYGLRATETQTRLSSARGDLDAVDATCVASLNKPTPVTPIAAPPSAAPPTACSSPPNSPPPQPPSAARPTSLWSPPRTGASSSAGLRTSTPNAWPPPPPPQEAELLQGIDHIELGYWSGAWSPTWDKEALPTLIRLRLVFPKDDPRHWPDIIAAPMRQRAD